MVWQELQRARLQVRLQAVELRALRVVDVHVLLLGYRVVRHVVQKHHVALQNKHIHAEPTCFRSNNVTSAKQSRRAAQRNLVFKYGQPLARG